MDEVGVSLAEGPEGFGSPVAGLTEEAEVMRIPVAFGLPAEYTIQHRQNGVPNAACRPRRVSYLVGGLVKPAIL
jgi:hypothetical protein